jgi:hypothetical protein
MKMSGKFRTLRADEIDVRVSQSVPNQGVSLLLYKDARADMTILDETVGAENWQRRHTRENANCIVSIWDDKKAQWIEKEDTGTESNTEKEKGLASDSFKRACTNWGIGRELYTSPFIWVNADKIEWQTKNGKQIPKTRFMVADIGYDEAGRIDRLVIKTGKGETVFTLGRQAEGKQKPPAVQIKKTTADKLLAELERTGVSGGSMLKSYNVKALAELTDEQGQEALKKLAEKPTKNAGV